MIAWTTAEVENVVGLLRPLVGTRLQEVLTNGSDVVLGFYSADGLLWLWLDLNATRPCLLPWSDLPLRPRQEKSPLHLFLRAHFVNRVLREVQFDGEHGRVVRFSLGGETEDDARVELEARLFPHGRNLIARAAGKSVAWQKPKPMTKTPEEYVREAEGPAHLPKRTLDELRAQWLDARQVKKTSKRTPGDTRARLEQDLARKQKALAKVKDELKRKLDMPWKDVGDWLKTHQSLDVPVEWEPFVDKRRKLSWNIEECFRKARELDGKTYGTEQRLCILVTEIERVRELLAGPDSALPAEPERPPPRPLKDLGAEGRTLRLSQDVVVVAGKSAADNMKLLRKARAWDLWIHLRDYPSSHAILFRNKNANIGDAVLHQVFAWFIRNHFGQKHAEHGGERFDVLVAECRFVRPIKGDKIGRVTYHDERVFVHRLD